MHLNVSDKGKLVGRVLAEALPNGAVPEVTSRVLMSKPAPNGLTTVINTQTVGETRYFDAGGFVWANRRSVRYAVAGAGALNGPFTSKRRYASCAALRPRSS